MDVVQGRNRVAQRLVAHVRHVNTFGLPVETKIVTVEPLPILIPARGPAG